MTNISGHRVAYELGFSPSGMPVYDRPTPMTIIGLSSNASTIEMQLTSKDRVSEGGHMQKRLFVQSLAGGLFALTCWASTAQAAEVLIIDATESANCGLFGHRKDFSYPVGGRKITRHDFKLSTRGHANASISSMDSNQVTVHAWCDLFSGYTFTLKVWAEQ